MRFRPTVASGARWREGSGTGGRGREDADAVEDENSEG
jgi:hypothetical protein